MSEKSMGNGPLSPAFWENPFSTRRITVGTVPFLFSCEKDENMETFIQRFERSQNFGQIVGPHGTGKSTFLHEFLSRLRDRDGKKTIHAITLRDKQRKLPLEFRKALDGITNTAANTIVVVDGYEQLAWSDRFFLRWFRVRRKCGLLLTSHQNVFAIPVLLRTKSDFDVSLQLVDFLLQKETTASNASNAFKISRKELHRLFQKHNGNLRLMLFSLYDLYEESRTF